MPVNGAASSSEPDTTLGDAHATGGPDNAPHIAWNRVDRRRRIGAPLTMAPELTAMPGGGTSPERVLGPTLVLRDAADRSR